MKASQAISSEIVLSRLMDKLMRIVLENAGAQKGFLILERNGEYFVETQGSVDKDFVGCGPAIPLESCTNVSTGIVNYVKRTGQTVVLGDACKEGIFKADPYVQRNQIKSVLCMPVLKQGQLIGILYLENNLGSNTFTSARLEALKLLSTQIATSLENAMFYEETNQLNLALKQENLERKRAEEALRESERKLRLQKKALMELAKSDAFVRGDFEAAIREITETSASTLEVERVSVWIYKDDESKIQCLDLYELSQKKHSRDQELVESDFPEYFQTLKAARTIAADEAHSDNRTVELSKSYLQPLGINSMLDAPIRMRGKLVGVICHEHIGPARHWSLEEQSFAGSVADMVALALESVELKQAEEELRKSEKYFRSLIENAQDVVMILDANKSIRYVSPAIYSVLGYKPEELLHTNADDLMNPEDLQRMQKAFRLLMENPGPHKSQEFRFRHKDGTWHFVEAIAKNIVDDPDVAGIVVNFRDVTERKVAELLLEDYSKNLEKKVVDRTQEIRQKNDELEKTLQQLKDTQAQLFIQEKMASLGNLVAGVAHEINNPIGAVNSAAAILNRCVETITSTLEKSNTLEEVKSDARFQKSIRILKENTDITAMASERIVKIVRSLKNFARLDEAEFQQADIHEGMDNTLTLLHHEMKNKVGIVKEYGKIPLLNCYPNQLNQVFMNILANANQAIDGKGTITIRTFANGQNVMVQIADTGKGIAPENLTRIFDPGFTTKGVGVGTGLGLSISYNIIQKHHGKIDVQSEVGRGTTFTITLPIEQKS
jgi:PAS domain S-box-containing protein